MKKLLALLVMLPNIANASNWSIGADSPFSSSSIDGFQCRYLKMSSSDNGYTPALNTTRISNASFDYDLNKRTTGTGATIQLKSCSDPGDTNTCSNFMADVNGDAVAENALLNADAKFVAATQAYIRAQITAPATGLGLSILKVCGSNSTTPIVEIDPIFRSMDSESKLEAQIGVDVFTENDNLSGLGTSLSSSATPVNIAILSDTGGDTTIGAATNTNAGLMLPAQKTKLDGIQSGATAGIGSNGTNCAVGSYARGVDADGNAEDCAVDAGSSTNLSANASTISLTVVSDTGADASLPAVTTSTWGVMTDEDKVKLDGIAAGATVGLGSNPTSCPAGQVVIDQAQDGTLVCVNDDDVPDAGEVTNSAIANSAVGISKLSATGTPDSTKFLRGDNTWSTSNLSDESSPTLNSNLNVNGNDINNLDRVGGAIYYATTQSEFAAALTRCGANYGGTSPTGCTIQLSCGTITWDDQWIGAADNGALSHSGLVIRGCGAGGLTASGGGPNDTGSTTILNATQAKPMLSLGSCDSCRIEDLEFDGNDIATIGVDWADSGGGFPTTHTVMRNIRIHHVNGPAIRTGSNSNTLSSLTRSGTTATATTPLAHDLGSNQDVEISGASDSAYNGVKRITVTSPTTFTFTVSGSAATPAFGASFFSALSPKTQVDRLRVESAALDFNDTCYEQRHSQSVGIEFDTVSCSQPNDTGAIDGFDIQAGDFSITNGYFGAKPGSTGQIFINRRALAGRTSVVRSHTEWHGTSGGYFIKDDDISAYDSGTTWSAGIIDGNDIVYDAAMTCFSVKREGAYQISNNIIFNQGAPGTSCSSSFASDADSFTQDRLLLQEWGNIETSNVASVYPQTWKPTIGSDVDLGEVVIARDTPPGDCRNGQIWVDTNGTSGQRINTCESGSWVAQAGNSGNITAVGPSFNTGSAFTDGTASTGTDMLVWEGTSVDANELRIISPSSNPGADINLTLPSTSGNIIGSGDVGTVSSTMITDSSITGDDVAASIAGDGLVKDTAATPDEIDINPGLGLRISSDQIGIDTTALLSGDHSLSSNEEKFGASGIIFEGSTADSFETYLSITNPTAERTVTIPDANSSTIQAFTCTGNDKVSSVSSSGVISCSPDLNGGSSLPVTDTTSIAQGSSDVTRQVRFEVDGIPNSTTRVITPAPGADSVTVAPDAGTTNNFLTGITSSGVVTKAQPDFSNLAGTATDAQVSNTLTASIFIGSGSTTNAADLATAEVSGTLGVANGGTGATTLTSNAILKGAGTSAVVASGVTVDSSNNVDGVATFDADGAVTGPSFTADEAANPLINLDDTIATDSNPESRINGDATADDNGRVRIEVEDSVDGTYYNAVDVQSTAGAVSVSLGGNGSANFIKIAEGGILTGEGTATIEADALTGTIPSAVNLAVTDEQILNAGVCDAGTTGRSLWSTPASNGATIACRAGTNVIRATLDYADGSDLSAQNSFILPATFSGNIDAIISWSSGSTSTNAVLWKIAIACVASGESDDPAFTDDNFTADSNLAVADQMNITTTNPVTTTGSCSAGETAFVRVRRDSADGSDTLAATARLHSVRLFVQRTL